MWLAALLLAALAGGSACPEDCACREPALECRGRAPAQTDFDSLPAELLEARLREVPAGEELLPSAGPFLARLRSLEVTGSPGPAARWAARVNASLALPALRALNLSGNSLESLGRVPQDLPQLLSLDASRNNLSRLAAWRFESEPRLTWLSLAGNLLDFIHEQCFRQLTALEHLDLSDNRLYSLGESLAPLVALQRLNLAGNKLKYVRPEWFSNLGRLVDLDISRNRFNFVPASALQSLGSLSVFKLAENPLVMQDLSLLLGTGRRLEAVDASRVGLARVPAALTRSIRSLCLAGNQLTAVNSGDLDSYPLLRLLDMSGNRLIIIEEDALGRLDGLEELLLAGNILPTVPKSLPAGLRLLDLRQNAISVLHANDLQGLYLLEDLNLSGNVISVIEGGSLRQLPALRRLDLSDNPIKQLPADALTGPANLVTLRLSGLVALRTEEDRNRDTAFPILAPEHLVTLDVSRSAVLAAQLLGDNAALSACKSLQELDLSYTNVSAMRSDLAYVLPQLHKLNLIGNEWLCTEDQFWLGEWLRQHKASLPLAARCARPAELEGKLLQELPASASTPTAPASLATPTTALAGEETMQDASAVPDALEDEKDVTTDNPMIDASSWSPEEFPSSSSPVEDQEEEATIAAWASSEDPEEVTIAASASPATPEATTNAVPTSSAVQSSSAALEDEPKGISTSSTLHPSSAVSDEATSIIQTSSVVPESSARLEEIRTVTEGEQEQGKPNAQKIISEEDYDTFITTTPKPPETTSRIPLTRRPDVPPRVTPPGRAGARDWWLRTTNMPRRGQRPEEERLREAQAANRVALSELLHSKLLADSAPRNVPSKSDARTSESLAPLRDAPHPGMLVLLGAAIGAAAALTLVLSRRATARRRDRQYQRHENIEVHALTPTAELW